MKIQNKSLMTRVSRAALISLLFMFAATVVSPMATAATCRAGTDDVGVECHSDGPGACAAAAWSGATGSSGAGCTAFDYK